MKYAIIILGAVFIFGVYLQAHDTPDHTPQADAKPPAAQVDTIEYKMAVVNAGGFVEHGSGSEQEFGTLLNRLDAQCDEGRGQLADELVAGHNLLDIDLSLLELTYSLSWSVFPYPSWRGDCAPILAVLITSINN